MLSHLLSRWMCGGEAASRCLFISYSHSSAYAVHVKASDAVNSKRKHLPLAFCYTQTRNEKRKATDALRNLTAPVRWWRKWENRANQVKVYVSFKLQASRWEKNVGKKTERH